MDRSRGSCSFGTYPNSAWLHWSLAHRPRRCFSVPVSDDHHSGARATVTWADLSHFNCGSTLWQALLKVSHYWNRNIYSCRESSVSRWSGFQVVQKFSLLLGRELKSQRCHCHQRSGVQETRNSGSLGGKKRHSFLSHQSGSSALYKNWQKNYGCNIAKSQHI